MRLIKNSPLVIAATSVVLAGLAIIYASLQTPASQSPNIIIILADDLGYADISLHKGDIPTPNIDSIASAGVQFTNGYATHSSCSPSRAGLLTGRHQMRFGFISNPDRVQPTSPGNPLGLPLDEITLAEVLSEAGYYTGAVGKWHLGLSPDLHPLEQGFDEFYGFLNSLHRYFLMSHTRILRGREQTAEKEYLTHAFTREAIDFIERRQDDPFLLYLAYNAVHTPLMLDTPPAKGEEITLHGTGDIDRNRAIYRNMAEALDNDVGEILEKLRTLGLDDNTVVFFMGDNGGAELPGAYDNTPLRDFKGTLYEGGIRVPFLVQWPSGIPRGTRYDHPVSAMDIFTTAAALAQAELPIDRHIDGINLLPYLTGEIHTAPHEALFWNWDQAQHAVRRGNWKLIQRKARADELYNLEQDIAEKTNLAASRQDVVKELSTALRKWQNELEKPLWEPIPQP
jgi:arylsulfatase A-like enzyme